MRQNALTILTLVNAGEAPDLARALEALSPRLKRSNVFPFAALDLLHFASWVVIHKGESGPQLVFESNFDGPPEAFLGQLVTYAKAGLDRIYRHCPGYPIGGSAGQVQDYLSQHIVYTDTFYVGCVGFGLRRIRQEADLRERMEVLLNRTIPAGLEGGEIRRRIQEFVNSEPSLAWAKSPAEGWTVADQATLWVPAGLAAVALAAAFALLWWAYGWKTLAAALAALFVILFVMLRIKERGDVPDEPRVEPGHLRRLAAQEDFLAQNHLASVTQVKPGLFRFLLLKAVLAFINLAARFIATKGALSGITSIHFARWAMINRGRQLLFLSNFDGSWEHYLGEFVDRAAKGLTSVWSNTAGFPRACALLYGGAANEQEFKYYARRSQEHTRLWYSAYPYLSMENILNNAEIRKGLWGPLEGKRLQAWLARF